MAAHPRNSSTAEAEAGGWRVSGWSVLYKSIRPIGYSVSKRKKKRREGEKKKRRKDNGRNRLTRETVVV